MKINILRRPHTTPSSQFTKKYWYTFFVPFLSVLIIDIRRQDVTSREGRSQESGNRKNMFKIHLTKPVKDVEISVLQVKEGLQEKAAPH